jgi:hypothetical protein
MHHKVMVMVKENDSLYIYRQADRHFQDSRHIFLRPKVHNNLVQVAQTFF